MKGPAEINEMDRRPSEPKRVSEKSTSLLERNPLWSLQIGGPKKALFRVQGPGITNLNQAHGQNDQ